MFGAGFCTLVWVSCWLQQLLLMSHDCRLQASSEPEPDPTSTPEASSLVTHQQIHHHHHHYHHHQYQLLSQASVTRAGAWISTIGVHSCRKIQNYTQFFSNFVNSSSLLLISYIPAKNHYLYPLALTFGRILTHATTAASSLRDSSSQGVINGIICFYS